MCQEGRATGGRCSQRKQAGVDLLPPAWVGEADSWRAVLSMPAPGGAGGSREGNTGSVGGVSPAGHLVSGGRGWWWWLRMCMGRVVVFSFLGVE